MIDPNFVLVSIIVLLVMVAFFAPQAIRNFFGYLRKELVTFFQSLEQVGDYEALPRIRRYACDGIFQCLFSVQKQLDHALRINIPQNPEDCFDKLTVRRIDGLVRCSLELVILEKGLKSIDPDIYRMIEAIILDAPTSYQNIAFLFALPADKSNRKIKLEFAYGENSKECQIYRNLRINRQQEHIPVEEMEKDIPPPSDKDF